MSKTNNSKQTKWSGAIFCIGCGAELDHDVPIEELQEWNVFDNAMCLSCHDEWHDLNQLAYSQEKVDELITSIANWD